jgi:hypothetical protein
MTCKHYYKEFPREPAFTLYEAITNTSRGSYDPPLVTDWIEEQAKSYISEEWDNERFPELIWKMRNSDLIVTLAQKLGINVDNPDLNRTTVKALLADERLDNKEKELIQELLVVFDDDLKSKRDEWAYERAADDFSCSFDDIDKGDDQEVADFFGISAEIVGYHSEDQGCIDVNDCVGFCDCDEPITKKSLYQFSDSMCNPNFEYEEVGQCPECGQPLYFSHIKNEELKLLLAI